MNLSLVSMLPELLPIFKGFEIDSLLHELSPELPQSVVEDLAQR
jgi:hypothetical protein